MKVRKMDRMFVSVIMPAFNSIQFLQESIDSILHQSHTNFEFIILDDGSVESVWDLIQSYDDSRIVAIRNPENIGLTKSLNICLDRVRGNFVMRHDSDDVSLPTRIEEQLKLFKENVGFVVCWYNNLVLKNNVWEIKAPKYRIFTKDLLSTYTKFNNGNDPGTMYSIEAVRRVGYFDERLRLGQTYNYNRRIQRFFKGVVVPKVLYSLRQWDGQVTIRSKKLFSGDKKVNWHKLSNEYAEERLVIKDRK